MKLLSRLTIKLVVVLTLILCLISPSFSPGALAQEPTDEPTDCPEVEPSPEPTEIPSPPPLSYTAEVSDETMNFTITLNYSEENSWIYGTWQRSVEGEPLRIAFWGGPVDADASFSSERNVRIGSTWESAVLVSVSGKLISETEVEGTFTYNDSEPISWAAAPYTLSSESTEEIPPNTITGRIFRSDMASLVEGAQVSLDKWVYNCGELVFEPVATITTGEDGVYIFADVEPGQYSFTVELNVTGEISPCETNGFEIRSDGIRLTKILDNGDYVLSRGDYGNFTIADGEVIEQDLDLYCS